MRVLLPSADAFVGASVIAAPFGAGRRRLAA
jgi:hypothetical protein